MPAASIIWTDQRVDELRARWAAGDTTNAIAKALGVTRNAVVGKASRLKLGSKPSSKRAPVVKPPSKRALVAKRVAKPKLVLVTAPPSASSANPWVRPSWHNRTYRLVDLTNHTCRWPLWESDTEPRLYCGLAANLEESRPYCAKHAKIAFVPARPR